MSNETAKNSKIQWIALMQVISTMLIVFSHSIVVGIEHPNFITYNIQSIQVIGLTAFMVSSGYLLVRSNAVKKYGYSKYLLNRFIRLMVPFFACQIIMICPKILLASLFDVKSGISLDSVLCGFLIPREGVLPHLWFLPVLMLMCMISPVLLFLAKKPAGMIIGTVVLLAISLIPDVTNVLCLADLLHYLVWYFVGICAARLVEESDIQKIKPWVLVLLMAISAAAYVTISAFASFAWAWYTAKSVFSLIFLFSISVLVNAVGGISKYTFPVYILSLPAQNLAELILARMQTHWTVSIAIMLLVGIVVPLAVALVVELIEKKRKIRPLSRIIGL